MLYGFARLLLGPCAKLYNGLKVIHKEKIPETGPYIVVANHQSYVDPIYVGLSLPGKLQFMAKAESFSKPFLGWALPRLGAFPVNRNSNDVKAVKRALQILKAGGVLGIFPEGTRTSEHDQAFKNGAAYFAIKLGVPVLPIGIVGTDKVMKKGSSFIRPARVKIIVGDLIQPNGEKIVNDDSLQVLSDKIKEELRRLQKEWKD